MLLLIVFILAKNGFAVFDFATFVITQYPFIQKITLKNMGSFSNLLYSSDTKNLFTLELRIILYGI